MTPDRVEAMLRSEIPGREREFVARPLPATVAEARDALTSTRSSNRVVMIAATLAAAAVVLVIGWTAVRSIVPDGGAVVGDGGTGSPSPSVAPDDGASVLPACGADDFVAASDPWDSAAGSRGTRVVLRVVDSTPACVLPARWAAEIADADRATLVRSTDRTFVPREVTAGSSIELGVSWSNWCGEPPVAPQLLLLFDADSLVVGTEDGSPVLTPPCMGSGEASSVNIGYLEPSESPAIGE